jgi:hypothetical protein
MNTITKLFYALVILLLFGLLSCTAPVISDSWMDESYLNSKFNNMLVIGAAEKITFRNLFEGQFVNNLLNKGVEATPSYTVMRPNEPLSRSTVLPLVDKLGIEAVIVTNLIDTKVKKVYYQVDSGNFYTYYNGVRGVSVSRSGNTSSYEVPILVLKTNLYDVRTEKLIWSITSESEYEYSMDSINSAIKLIISSLIQDGMI